MTNLKKIETWLLDSNVLIALATESHTEHRRATHWFSQRKRRFATCPITQGALLRFYMNFAVDKRISKASELLSRITAMPQHSFWRDELSYLEAPLERVIGHKQITDAYLVGLARHNKGIIATMDEGLSALHRENVELLPGK